MLMSDKKEVKPKSGSAFISQDMFACGRAKYCSTRGSLFL